jgi:hypothetical protein
MQVCRVAASMPSEYSLVYSCKQPPDLNVCSPAAQHTHADQPSCASVPTCKHLYTASTISNPSPGMVHAGTVAHTGSKAHGHLQSVLAVLRPWPSPVPLPLLSSAMLMAPGWVHFPMWETVAPYTQRAMQPLV